MRKIPAAVAAVALACALVACKKEPETPGEHLDHMLDKAKEGAEKAGEKAEDLKRDLEKR